MTDVSITTALTDPTYLLASVHRVLHQLQITKFPGYLHETLASESDPTVDRARILARFFLLCTEDHEAIVSLLREQLRLVARSICGAILSDPDLKVVQWRQEAGDPVELGVFEARVRRFLECIFWREASSSPWRNGNNDTSGQGQITLC
jgi:hypothetical protein